MIKEMIKTCKKDKSVLISGLIGAVLLSLAIMFMVGICVSLMGTKGTVITIVVGIITFVIGFVLSCCDQIYRMQKRADRDRWREIHGFYNRGQWKK